MQLKRVYKKYLHSFYLAGALALANTTLLVSSTQAESSDIDRVIVVVNDDVIMQSEFNQRMGMVLRQLQKQEQTPPPPAVLRGQVLERLIVESLQLQLAERVDLQISADEIQQTIQNIAQQNKMSVAQFQQAIQSDGLDFANFQKNIAKDLIIQRLQQGVVNGRIDISEQDIDNFLHSEEGKQSNSTRYRVAHILLTFDPDNDAASKAALEQANSIINNANEQDSFMQLAQQYSQAGDAAQGGDLGWRRQSEMPSLYSQIVTQLETGEVSEPILARGSYHIIKLLDKQGDQEYWVQQTRARHILAKPSLVRSDKEAADILLSLRNQIMAGEISFEEAAKANSEDYGTALKGGDLDWTTPGQLVPEFQTVMDNSTIGAISMPFQSQYGWHILEVTERRNKDMSDRLIRESVRNYLQQRRFQEELPRWLKEIRDEAYIDIKD